MALVSLFAAATFSACDKDKDNGDEATSAITDGVFVGDVVGVETVTFDSIRALIGYYDGTEDHDIIIGSATINGGKLTLTLSKTLDGKYLDPLFANPPSGVTVSNESVKGGTASVYAYKSGSRTGNFYYATGTEDGAWNGRLTYAESNVSVTGSDVRTNEDGGKRYYNYGLHLKKGWNIMYVKDIEDEAKNEWRRESTTTAPSGEKWYYNANAY
jgi:hypothetical protein